MRLTLTRTALVITAAILLGSCDSAGPPPVDGVVFTPLADDSSLFPSPNSSDSAARVASGRSPTFGCYLSSPNLGASEAERYRLDRTMVAFPRDVIARAGGEVQMVVLTFGSPTLYAEVPRLTPTVVRKARCVVPDDDEAVQLLKEALGRFDESDGALWEGEPMSGLRSANSNVRASLPPSVDIQAREANMMASTTASGGTSCSYVDTEYWTMTCSGGVCTHRLDFVDRVWTCVQADGPSGGGPTGGGGAPTGPSPEPCDGGAGGESYFPTTDQSGLGCDQEADDPVESHEIHEWYRDRCDVNISVDPGEANNLWSDNVAESFGVKVESKDSKSPGYRPLDGYKVHNGYITSIYEVKNTRSWTFSGDDIDQAIGHIDRLIEHREALRNNAGGVLTSITAPTYVVITTSPHENLDYHNRIFDHARDNGINIRVYRPQSRYGVDWYFAGERSNSVLGGYDDWYAGIPHDAIPNWLDWIDPTKDLPDEGLRMNCTPEVIREGAPKSPPGS